MDLLSEHPCSRLFSPKETCDPQSRKHKQEKDRLFPLKAPHTYLQGHIGIHAELRHLISPRQEFFSFVVQIIIKDGSLGWKLHDFHFFMPPSTKVSLIIRKLWRTGELVRIDPERIQSLQILLHAGSVGYCVINANQTRRWEFTKSH